MELVAFIGSDRENWGQVSALIKRAKWEKIIIVKNKNAEEFAETGQAESIEINSDRPIVELKSEIIEKIKKKLSGDFEIALSIASGSGKEHMAIIAALLSVPVGVKLVVFTKEGVEYIN